jgi:potassium voltage-gated channel Shal-related subfamily D member 2
MDLLAILPYYIEIALQKDTVSLFPSNLSPVGYLIRCSSAHPQSTLFRFSILRTFRLLRVFRPFRYNSTLLLCVPFFFGVSFAC